MSTEGAQSQSETKEPIEHDAPTDSFERKIRIMRNTTVTLTIVALAMAAILLAAGGTAVIASNIGIESLTLFRIPLDSIVGLTACLIITVGARTYTSLRHNELLVERHIASSK